jgi:hypothetical protein
MNDVECVWWCRTPRNSAEYGSGERRIALQLYYKQLYGPPWSRCIRFCPKIRKRCNAKKLILNLYVIIPANNHEVPFSYSYNKQSILQYIMCGAQCFSCIKTLDTLHDTQMNPPGCNRISEFRNWQLKHTLRMLPGSTHTKVRTIQYN